MKTLLIALTLTAASSAFAAGDTQEATPYTNSKAQAHGEDHKKARPATGVKQIKDGGTARGEGSGLADTSKAEARGEPPRESWRPVGLSQATTMEV